MEGIPAENIIVARNFLVGLEGFLLVIASIMLLLSAKKFYTSPAKPPYPLRYKQTPPHFILAFIITVITVSVRSLVIGSLAINSTYELRIFTAMFLLFTAIAGVRRIGEAPISGMILSLSSAFLILSSLLCYSPTAYPATLPHQNIVIIYKLLLALGYSLMFTSLTLVISRKLRPPLDEMSRSRGLSLSSNLLTDHRHKELALYRAAVPVLLFSLTLQCVWNVLAQSILFDFTIDTLFSLMLLWIPIIHLHFLESTDNPAMLFAQNRTSTFLSRTICSLKGGAIAIGISALPVIWFVILPALLGGTPNNYYGGLGATLILFISLVPCFLKRTGDRHFNKHELISFDQLMNSESNVPMTTVEVNNPHLKRVDLDNALVMLGFVEYTVSDLDPHNDSFRVASFGIPLTGLSYINHLLYLLLFLQLPIMACSQTPMYWLFCLTMGMCAFILTLQTMLPRFLIAYHIEPRKETCLMTMRIYASGFLASPSKLVKHFTSHLVVEHESML